MAARKMSPTVKSLLFWIAVVVIGFVIWQFWVGGQR
jgi:hypothetical protein